MFQLPMAPDAQPMTDVNAQPRMASDTEAMTATNASRQGTWAKHDLRLPNDWAHLTLDWLQDHTLRTDYAPRQALVELDVPAVKNLGLTLDELQTIYLAQFRIMRQYEAETYYDAKDRIAVTPSKDLPKVNPLPKVIKGDISYTLTTPDGTEEGTAFGWGDACDMQRGINACRIESAAMLIHRQLSFRGPFSGFHCEPNPDTGWKD